MTGESMEKFELDPALSEEIRRRVFGDGFIKIVQSVRRGGSSFKISLRPVSLGGEVKYQAEMTDAGKVQVRNFNRPDARAGLEEIISQKGARELHLICSDGDLHVRVTKKGHVLASRSGKLDRPAEIKPHDRVKNLPLSSFDSSALLRVTGIADGSGNIRASMRGKYDQVNEFLKVVDSLALKPGKAEGDGEPPSAARPFIVVDCGCGKAYLTLALALYLTQTVGLPRVKVYGVDRRDDVIESARKMAKSLDLEDMVEFSQSDLADFQLDKADMVVSLHACDTATDEALAKGVEWKARYILCAPCRQHELQKSLAGLSTGVTGPAAVFGGLLRQSILRERLCDILTDSFRAMIMRILGFRTQVFEFVAPDATARNIMLKCEYSVKSGQSGPVNEYLALRDYWGVTPWLEGRLAGILAKHLERYA